MANGQRRRFLRVHFYVICSVIQPLESSSRTAYYRQTETHDGECSEFWNSFMGLYTYRWSTTFLNSVILFDQFYNQCELQSRLILLCESHAQPEFLVVGSENIEEGIFHDSSLSINAV